MKHINEWTVEEFRKLPHRKWDEDVGVFSSLIILPSEIRPSQVMWYNIKYWLAKHIPCLKKPEIYDVNGMHDSGYRCMDFVAVKEGKPLCLLSGCSDVLHIDGIGGYGKWIPRKGFPNKVELRDWNIDCLPTSGLLRLWCRGGMTAALALSSFEIYAEGKKKEVNNARR